MSEQLTVQDQNLFELGMIEVGVTYRTYYWTQLFIETRSELEIDNLF